MTTARPEVREDADIESSSDRYADRFTGAVGGWFLEVQARLTLKALDGLGRGARVLDVGGGHAQLTPALVTAGYSVTVVGSDPACARRLRPWLDRGECRYHAADLLAMPFDDRSFDAVLCYRLIAHSVDWHRLLRELCRVAGARVVIDYPSRRSLNLISESLFPAKQRLEGGSTRRFLLYSPREIREGFVHNAFRVVSHTPQFLLPMVVHRVVGSRAISRAVETPGRLAGLTRWWGSPVIVRADRSP
jgi:ubiquinone/menaquinone biosynthesis C-methylase UbiE